MLFARQAEEGAVAEEDEADDEGLVARQKCPPGFTRSREKARRKMAEVFLGSKIGFKEPDHSTRRTNVIFKLYVFQTYLYKYTSKGDWPNMFVSQWLV